jgi:hypothetical protein
VIMRIHLRPGGLVLASIVTAVCARAAAAQSTPAAADTTAKKSTGKLLTLDGCVTASATKGEWVLSDAKGHELYRLSGTDAHEYLGRRVQVSGVPSRRVQIGFGLYPSPNVAAQAGAIDSTQAAIAAVNAGTTSQTAPLPQLRVKSVQPVAGSCPQR